MYRIQGITGQLDMWLNRFAFEPTIVERLDEMFASGECPPAVVTFVDAWTSYSGSQFINSASTGRYMDYLCDEVVPFDVCCAITQIKRLAKWRMGLPSW